MAEGADPAARRFAIIQLVRLSGVVIAVYMLLVLGDAAPWPGDLPRWLAYGFFLIGLVGAMVVPRALARAWSSERPKRDNRNR